MKGRYDMNYEVELPTISAHEFPGIRERFLRSFVDDEEYIQFAMSSIYNGKEKQNCFQNKSGLIWEHLSPDKRFPYLQSMALDYLREKKCAEILMLTDAYKGKIACGESPIFIVTFQIVKELLYSYPYFWNLYLFDDTFHM